MGTRANASKGNGCYDRNSGLCSANSPFGNEAYRWIAPQTQAAREAIASELYAPSETITLTQNVTVGCNIAMWGIDWHSGDHILLSDCEHPGVIATTQEIARRFAVEVTTCPLKATLNEGDPVKVIAQHLRHNTRLVILSHVFWNTGQVLPLDKIAEVCRDNHSFLLIDAAQSVGLLPLNLTELGVDFYAFTGHKWLCACGCWWFVCPARSTRKPEADVYWLEWHCCR